MSNKTKNMSYEEKLIYYATAPRATAGKITQIVKGELVDFYLGRLRGNFVRMGDGELSKFKTKEEALKLARKFRQSCLDEAIEKGLLKACE